MEDEAISQNEFQVLRVIASSLNNAPTTFATVLDRLPLSESQSHSAIGYLLSKRFIEAIELEVIPRWLLTKLGKAYADEGLPELRLWHHILPKRSLSLSEVGAILQPSEIKFVVGFLKSRGLITIDQGQVHVVNETLPESTDSLQRYLRVVRGDVVGDDYDPSEFESAIGEAKERRLVRFEQVPLLGYRLTDKAKEYISRSDRLGDPEDVIDNVTAELLSSGEWRHKQFRPYGVLLPPLIRLELRHPLTRLTSYLRRCMLSTGFREVNDSPIESAFWNIDALFVPTFHAVRGSKHLLQCDDAFLPHNDAPHTPQLKLWRERLRAEYEGNGNSNSRGWGSTASLFRDEVVVRSHTTSITVKSLVSAELLPTKLFTLGRCCRASPKAPELLQLDALIADSDLNLATLLGSIRQVCSVIFPDAFDIRVQGIYLPFAEIAFDVFVVRSDGKEYEVGAGGLLRPETRAAFDITIPVGLIGFNISRLARFLTNNPKALASDEIGFESFEKTEIM